jgi:cyclophilin family peptidyl-prolyl cis-trans isomerase
MQHVVKPPVIVHIPDTTPPVVTLDPLSSTTVSTNPTITGKITDDSGGFGLNVTVSVDGGVAHSIVVTTSGQFSFTTTFATNGTANGPHLIRFFGFDASGNQSTPASASFTLTANSTNLTLALDPASDTGTPGNNITELAVVTLKGTGPKNTTITLTLPGNTTTTTQSDATGAYSFANVALSNGPNTFTVTATDSGNQHLSTSLTVTRNTAPTVAAAVSNFSVAQNAAKSVFNLPTIFSDQDVNTLLQFTTNRGTFDVELFNQQVGATVANFLSYVNGPAGANYLNSIFHRVTNLATDGIAVLQGGGFTFKSNGSTTALPAISTHSAIALQALLTNALGTIAMARTSDPNSATSQFFFNTADNSVLDPGGTDPNGYAVFGVIRGAGLSVVQASAAVPPVNEGGNFASIPLTGVPANDPTFPTNTTAANYEMITGVSVLRGPITGFSDSLTFSVSGNTNAALVTPTITNGKLSLAYAASQTGTSTITLTATDSDGATAQTSFTVTVGNDTTAPTVTITSPTNGASVNTSPAITGTATDNVAVTSLTAAVDGGAAQNVTLNADGTYSFNPNLAVNGTADGPHTVVFTAKDAAGNTSTPVSVTFKLDTTAPSLTITSPADGQTFATAPAITGKATDDQTLASLMASVDGGAAQAVTVDAQGNFTFTPSVTATTAHTVVFTATDAAGNTSTATLHFTLSTNAPAVTLTAPADGAAFKTNPAFTGSITSQSESGNLMVTVDGGTAQPVTVDAQGNFTFTPAATTDGTHTLVFSAGASFTNVSRSFVLDQTPPVVTIISPANGQSFAGNPTIKGTVVDATTSVVSAVASVDGGQGQVLNLDAAGNFSFIPPVASGGAADGPHTVSITATDAVGNVSAPIVVTYTLDTVPPAITISTGPADGVSGQPDPTYAGTVTDAGSGVSTLTASINGGTAQTLSVDAQGNFSFDPHLATDGSADGFYSFTFVARDVAGNQQTVVRTYYLDNTPPVVTLVSPANGQTFATNPTINLSATDNIGTGFAFASVDGGPATGISFATNGTFSFTPSLALDGSANGPHTVTFVARDAAGNSSAPVDFTFTLTVAAPAVTLTAPPDGQAFNVNPVFSGSVTSLSESANLTVSVDGGAAQPVTVDAQGNFNFTPAATGDGTHTLVFSANSPFTPVSRSFVLDTTAPAITITSPVSGQTLSSNPSINGTIVDATSGVATATASVDGGADQVLTLDAQGHFTFIPPVATGGAADGLHTVTIKATDVAGNAATPAVFTYTLDTTAPALSVGGTGDQSTGHSSPAYTGTVTDASGVASLTVSINGGPTQILSVDAQGNFSFNPNLPTDGSADGAYTFAFVAQDTVGNQTTVTRTYYLDNTAPVVTITSPPDGQVFATNPTINVTATDNIGTSFAYIIVDGGPPIQMSFPTNTGFSFSTNFATDGTANGPHTVTFIAYDAAGNASNPVTFHFTLTAP